MSLHLGRTTSADLKRYSAFCHIRETPGRAALTPGSKVSFMYEYDEKGGKARDVQIEEAAFEVEEVREMGTVKVFLRYLSSRSACRSSSE